MKKLITDWWRPIAWIFIILYLTLSSGEQFHKMQLFPNIDKLAHFGMYAVLQFLLLSAWLKHKNLHKLRFRDFLLLTVITISIGSLLEFLQGVITSSRSRQLMDAYANTAGCLVATLLFNSIYTLLKERMLGKALL